MVCISWRVRYGFYTVFALYSGPHTAFEFDFDQEFDAGDSVLGHLDLGRAKRVGLDVKRVNVDFPSWMVESLDHEAQRVGVTRQSLIKLWLADKLASMASKVES